MQKLTALLELTAEEERAKQTDAGFSFSSCLINSHNLRIYTAQGPGSSEISLSKISRHNQAREW